MTIRAVLVLALSLTTSATFAQDDQEAAIKHFEAKVLPVLKANCFNCHGAGDVKAGLRLSDQTSLLEGGESGSAVDLANPEESLLLNAINYRDYEMPPKGKLAQSQIDDITQWVKAGAPFPEDMLEPSDDEDAGGPPAVNDETKSWWAFQKVKRPSAPKTKAEWGVNAIDKFVLAKLEEKGLSPNTKANKVALLRRAYYDLVGLPPTPEEVRAFLADKSDSAFEKVLDNLLASEHYGEKWGRHWLDLVRYGETNSYERDGNKPYVWRYRDYVIRSFNKDKPYDQFVTEQLAGDELPNATPETIIATGYYRLGIWQDEPVDPLESMYNDLDDILVTTTDTFLGLTVGCARCHDHKIDPIPQKDYYSMLAFFRNIRRYGVRSAESVTDASVLEVDQPADQAEHQKLLTIHNQKLSSHRRGMKNLEDKVRRQLEGVEVEDFAYEMNRLAIMKNHVAPKGKKLLTLNQIRHYESLIRRIRELEAKPPTGLAKVLCVKENGKDSPPTFLLTRGNAHANGEQVEPGFPSVLSPPKPTVTPTEKTAGRRLALAKWIASKDNPLTARVIVNRIWQHHFGRGIVRSSSDYGFQGTPATHPELLDWLAAEFVDGGWTFKRMHKLIMLSDAYQMSSDRANKAAIAKDEANDYFWRFNPRRLVAEEVRDSILAMNGRLNTSMFGPSIYPEVPQVVRNGLSRPNAGWPTSPLEQQQRRSIYVHVKRSLALPMLASFDVADPDKPCPVRFVTTQPTQALGMLNSRFINDQAQALANSVVDEAGNDTEKQVALALWRTTQREPADSDIQRGLKLINDLQTKDGASANDALRYFCLVSLNLNEFMYLD
ncbi:MAG: PSD1 and planctomycete cytochrome C domain-containing protein [Planctomycetaceae bacterium]